MKPSYKGALQLFTSNLVLMQVTIYTRLQYLPVGLTKIVFCLFHNISLHSEVGFNSDFCLPKYLQILNHLKTMYFALTS